MEKGFSGGDYQITNNIMNDTIPPIDPANCDHVVYLLADDSGTYYCPKCETHFEELCRCLNCRSWGDHDIDCPVQSVEVRLQRYKDEMLEHKKRENYRIGIVKENMIRYKGRIATLILENNALRKNNKKLTKQLVV